MAEKTCPHGQPATSFCKACERGDPPPQQASTARMSLGRTSAAAAFEAFSGSPGKPKRKAKAKRKQ